MTDFTEGPPRKFLPVCVQRPHGFIGGPCGYHEVPPDSEHNGPIIIEEEGTGWPSICPTKPPLSG